MKETKPKFLDKLEENQLAQEIDNSIEEINNPVIKEEEIDNNPEPIITEEPIEEIKEEEITPTPEPIITEEPIAKAIPKNKVRIMDGNFPF